MNKVLLLWNIILRIEVFVVDRNETFYDSVNITSTTTIITTTTWFTTNATSSTVTTVNNSSSSVTTLQQLHLLLY